MCPTKLSKKSDLELQEAVVLDHLSEYQVRCNKVTAMRDAGIEPWPAEKSVNATCKQVIDEHETQAESKVYAIAGRLMGLREHGKSVFAHLQDVSGQVQLYFKKDLIGDQSFDHLLAHVDVGDSIWCTGVSFVTKLGEVTLRVSSFVLTSKCLYPLPEKFHGLADREIRHRQRYLDLMVNPETRERFKCRSAIMRYLREYLDNHGYMEVETPMLHPIAGGAAARPFMTHHNALDQEMSLRIAPELYLKRLVIGGFERVYEINRNFRNEGVSTRHNPEFTMLEFYTAHQEYGYIMGFVEQMIADVMQKSCGSLEVPFGERHLNFTPPFARLSMKQAVMQYAGCTEKEMVGAAFDAVLKKHNVTIEIKNPSWGQKLLAAFEALVEPQLIQPTFITEFPIEVSPLSKRDPQNPDIAARFELFVAGMELSNGFNELNDPFDQAQRFQEQLEAHKAGDHEAHKYDGDFIKALEYGLPPTTGVGIGIDRLVMLLTNTTSIKEVILFPTLKNKEEDK